LIDLIFIDLLEFAHLARQQFHFSEDEEKEKRQKQNHKSGYLDNQRI